MIPSKNRNAFTLIEAMFTIAIIALVLTPLFILQGTILQQVSRSSEKIERIFFAEQFMYEAKQAMPKEAKKFTLEKKIDKPRTLLKYELIPIPSQSSLAQVNDLFLESVIITWNDGTQQKQNKIVHFVYKPTYTKNE